MKANKLTLDSYINLPLGVIVGGFLLLNTIPERNPKNPLLEILGTAMNSLGLPELILIRPAVVMFLLRLQFGGNQYAWDSSAVLGLLIGAAVTFALFLIWEYYQRRGNDTVCYAQAPSHLVGRADNVLQLVQCPRR